MKKLLVATSALIAAGSAAALDVRLGGDLTSTVSYDSAAPAPITGPTLNASELKFTASGAANGWTYGAEMSFAGSLDSMTLGNDALGTLTMTSGNLKWEGMSVGGFALSASASTATLQDFTLGLSGAIGGISVEGDIAQPSRAFNLDFGTVIGGADVLIETTGDLDDTSTGLGYEVTVGMAAMGMDLGLNFGNGGHDIAAGTIGVSAGLGPVSLSMSLGDGDLLDDVTVKYETSLSDAVSVAASVSTGTSTTASVVTTMSF